MNGIDGNARGPLRYETDNLTVMAGIGIVLAGLFADPNSRARQG
ncbi:hypothetical protein AAGS40_09410 [Paraburkholderia sp. PREW-6R]